MRTKWWLEGETNEWAWDGIKEDATNVGIKLTAWDYGRYCEGELTDSLETVLKKIIKEHGEKCETHKTAKEYQEKYNALTEEDYDEKIEDLTREFLHDILEDYRIMMDKEVDYQQSTEYVEEIIRLNECEFTEDGEIA